MNFTQTLLNKLGLLFQRFNLKIVEQRNDFLKLQSESLIIIIVHNSIERSNTLWIGKNDNKADKIEIDNNVLSSFFKSNLKLSDVSMDTFINNLTSLFENEASSLLIGDKYRLEELERFDLERSHDYTKDILYKRYLAAADKAWDEKDYKGFINNIDCIDKSKLPTSYALKYEIACKK